MSFPRLSNYPNLGEPLVHTLIAEGQLDSPLFAFSLSSGGPSELDIGAVNPDLYSGALVWSAVTLQVCIIT